MDKNIQSLLIKSIVLFLAVLSIGIISWAYNNYRSAESIIDPQRTISFTAQGKVLAKPDIAKISFSVVTEGKEAAPVQKENNTKMQSVLNFVKKAGIKEDDIRTTQYDLVPQYDYTWCRRESNSRIPCSPKVIGYKLTQGVEVKIRDFDKINNIVGGLSQQGVNRISNIAFAIDDQEEYQNQARIQALQKIEKRAALFSRKTSVNLGKIVNIQEGATPSPVYRAMMEKAMVSAEEDSIAVPAPLEAGSQEITAVLTVSYALR